MAGRTWLFRQLRGLLLDRWRLHSSVTSAEIAQQPDLCTIVDVLDGDARDQAVDRQVGAVVGGAKLGELGVVERVEGGPEAVLGRVEPVGEPVAGSGHFETGETESLILEGPVAVDVGPRREVRHPPGDRRDRERVGWRPGVFADPLARAPAPRGIFPAPDRPARGGRRPEAVRVVDVLEQPAHVVEGLAQDCPQYLFG